MSTHALARAAFLLFLLTAWGPVAAEDPAPPPAPPGTAPGAAGAAPQPVTPSLPRGMRSPPHDRPVLVLVESQRLPEDVRFEVIERVKVRTGGYRDAEQVLYLRLADRARKLGADAVVDVTLWRQPAGFSWAAPHADGMAVRIVDPASAGDLGRFGKLY
jgi:uncharacterized protein YbjQ (UPF0145 family)